MAAALWGREWVRPEDNYWWRSENSNDLYTIHALILFDEPLDFAELKRWLEEQTRTIKRLRERLVVPRGRLSYPYWEPYSRFNVDEHVQHVTLRTRVDQTTLEQMIGGFLGTPLDYSRPLWEAYLVDGEGENCAVIFRTHHIVGDGVALVNLLLSAGGARTATLPEEEDEPGTVAQLSRTARHTLRDTVSVLRTGTRVLAHPRRSLNRGLDMASEVVWPLVIQPDPKTCLKRQAGIAKQAAFTLPIPLRELKALGRANRATVNDMVLTFFTGALARYLKERGQDLDGEEIRALLTVNVRPKSSAPTLDNYFGMLAVSLPLNLADPVERLHEIHVRMTELKQSAAPYTNYLLLSGLGLGPKDLQDAMTRIYVRRFSIMLTNVPGPEDKVSFAGKPISNLVFWAPGAGRPGAAISVLSYADKLNVAIGTDARRVPDPGALARGIEEEFRMFCR